MSITGGATILLALSVVHVILAKHYLTPLEIDKNLCKPENIKSQLRYTCTNKGEVQCQNGWTSVNDTDPLYPCATPLCSDGCVHGKCEDPDVCACDIGWEGTDCNTCIDLPGCVHGSCQGQGLACICTDSTQWRGGLCDQPICSNCVHGTCVSPGECKCHPGWTGPNCDQCVPLAGCNFPLGGDCVNRTGVAPLTQPPQIPNGCICNPGFTGHLCTEPLCEPACIKGHGECVFGAANTTNPICKCFNGWDGDDCGDCIVYPDCPVSAADGGCILPWQCICPSSQGRLCGIHEKGW